MDQHVEILRSVIVTTDIGTPGAGLLSPEQFESFWVLAETRHPWMALQNTVRRTAHTGNLTRMDFGGDVIGPASEAIDTGNFFKPGHDQVAYAMVKTRVAFKLSDESDEQSADPNYETKLVQKMTAAWGRSFQKLAWLGDTTSSDAMLKLNDGWVKRMLASGGNPVNGTTINGGAISVDHFYAAVEALPEAWKQRTDELRWAISPKKRWQIAKYLSNRTTGMGDRFITLGPDGELNTILGIKVVEVPAIGDTRIVLTSPENTTAVVKPTDFTFDKIDKGLEVQAQGISVYLGFSYSDFILMEPEGTAIIHSLTA